MKWTGAKSAGCNDFILTACVHNMTWGDLAHYNLDVGRDIAAMGRLARIREENDCMLNSD